MERTWLLACSVVASWFAAGMVLADPPDVADDAWKTADPVVLATNRGVALMERYEYAPAAEVFQRALELAPGSVECRFNLAVATFNRCAKGDVERAEALLDEIIERQPDHVRALYFRGIIHQYSGRDDQAVGFFERVVKLRPDDACTWYLLARSKSHLGQPCRAELERAVQENPALASAYYDLMRVAAQEGDQDRAGEYQQKFTELRGHPLCEMVVMPQYRQMGPLAVVQPAAGERGRSVAGAELATGPGRTVFAASPSAPLVGADRAGQTMADRILSQHGVQLAVADVNGDGRLDVVTTATVRDGRRSLLLLLDRADGDVAEATESSGLAGVRGAISCAFGDYDNDNKVDLFVSCAGPNYLFRGRGDGTFEDVTAGTMTAGSDVVSASAVFLDADHDADLDIYVCNTTSGDDTSPAANQLLNNNADGTFTDIAAKAGVACPAARSIMAAPADLDGDRDTDLIVFNLDAPVGMFFNDRSGKYHPGQITTDPIRGDHGGVCQDFNGDGRLDLLVCPGPQVPGRLYLSEAGGGLARSAQFDAVAEALATWGSDWTARVADLDLDGDLDIALFDQHGHVLLNDGWGRFVTKPQVWPVPHDDTILGTALADLDQDGAVDLLRVRSWAGGRIELVPTRLTPPPNWLAVTPTGDRGADQRTRSPASGFGTRLQLRCGLHSQVITYTGLVGGLSQSQQPAVFGLNGAAKADYLMITWSDGVTQCENELTAGTGHRISEMERRVSSCPVLFAWDGQRFAFVGDFAGVGGLGYFVGPEQYAPPQVLEHVKIEADQLAARNGFYELRVCEPMEEVAYVDRLELLAVDHPRGLLVYPDERLTITGPEPTHRLLCVANPVYPARATAPDGKDCAERLAEVDRIYAYQPRLDPRFIGFCEPHTVELGFADRLAEIGSPATARSEGPGSGVESGVYLFLTGSIEYPYSQTTFAAAQAGVMWDPMKIERQAGDGSWETIVADAGAPGGMGRTIAIDLSGKLSDGDSGDQRVEPALRECRLRITTNLEIYYDRVFIGADCGTADVAITGAPLASAEVRRLGFPLEYSPDGQHPTVYTYDVIEPTCSFKMPRGSYTRYGPVEELLGEFDDRYVILGSGDEIAVRFDGRSLPPVATGHVRSFVLVSHAYCKDMDLYTAEPDTVEPLPFRAMSAYPYPPEEHAAEGVDVDTWRRAYNTRTQP